MKRLAFLPLQNPKLAATPPSGEGWRHDIKFDGYRMQLQKRGSDIRWFSRNGNDWSDRLADFAADLSHLPNGVYDGEVVALDAKGHPDFSALRSAMGKRQVGKLEGELVYQVFDILRLHSKDLRALPLSQRKRKLEEALTYAGPRVREVTALPGGGAELLIAACQMLLEGIVSKRLTSTYDGGEVRNGCWIKSKCRPSQEVVVGGYEMDGSRFKALLAGVYEDGAFRYVGSLGTGFSQSVVSGLLPRLRAVESPVSYYTAGSPPRKTSAIHWTRPELVAAAEIAEWTESGKLRQASFKGLREDKAASSVVRDLS